MSSAEKRNIVEYERAGTTTAAEAQEMLQLATELSTSVQDWLRANHPALL